MRPLHVRARIKLNMLYIIAIVVAFIFLAISEDKHSTKQQKSMFTEQQIEYLQSARLITDEEIEEYRNNNQIISSN